MHTARKHPILAIGLSTALLLGTAACSDDKDDSVLKVCSDMPYEPFEYEGKGPRGLEYTGFDIELLDAMAESQDKTLDITDSDFDTIFASVNSGKCDVVASAVTITDERKENNRFTEPYLDVDQSLLVPADADVAALADLDSGTIGVQDGTTGKDYAEENAPAGVEIKAFPDAAALFAAINAGQIVAILQDLPVNSARAAKDDTVEVVETLPTGEQYGFAVAKDDADLQEELDTALAAAREDGTYDKLVAKYFPDLA